MPRPSREVPEASAFGQRVRKVRTEAGLTLAQVSEATGISAEVLSKLETSGTSNPKLSTIKKLAEALGVKPADLIGE